MERVLAAHNITGTGDGMGNTVVKSDLDDRNNSSQQHSKTFTKLLPDRIGVIRCVLADPGVVTKTDVGAIGPNCLLKYTNTLQSGVFTAVTFMFEDSL